MPLGALVTLPGAPLAVPAATSGLTTIPPELVRLRREVDTLAERVANRPCIVVCPATQLAVWEAGDLTLAGFGLPDIPATWWTGTQSADVARRLGTATANQEVPTEGRVVARLVGADNVTAIVGVPPDASEAEVLLKLDGQCVALVGDLSASVGTDSPRPGTSPALDALVDDGRVDATALRRHVHEMAPSVAAALQVALAPGAPPLFGEIHVVRGVATLVAASDVASRPSTS